MSCRGHTLSPALIHQSFFVILECFRWTIHPRQSVSLCSVLKRALLWRVLGKLLLCTRKLILDWLPSVSKWLEFPGFSCWLLAASSGLQCHCCRVASPQRFLLFSDFSFVWISFFATHFKPSRFHLLNYSAHSTHPRPLFAPWWTSTLWVLVVWSTIPQIVLVIFFCSPLKKVQRMQAVVLNFL
jgi:hypothetical protein